MTTLADFSFVINSALGTIHVNAVGATLTSNSLAANVQYVQFDASTGVGQIMYNDRPSIPELFQDPSPYQTYVNQWITAEAALAKLPLTLAQAQAVKCALVQAIYAVKRQQPVNVTVSAGNNNWDASDQAVARMNVLAGFAYIDNVNSLISTLNSEISTLNTNVTDSNGLRSAYTTFVTNLQTNLNSWVSTLNSSEAASINNPPASWTSVSNMSVPPAGSTTAMNTLSNISSITVPTMKLLPYGGTSLVTVTPTDVGAILSAIATQNANEAVANATKQAAVNALTTIANVVAYDATTGW